MRMRILAAALTLACFCALAGGATASHNAFEQLSLGPAGGNDALPAQWVGASDDGTRVVLRTEEPLVSSDTDAEFDLYLRGGGTTAHLSTGPSGGNLARADVTFAQASSDADRVFFVTSESLVPSDTDDCDPTDPAVNGCTDVYRSENGTTSLISAGGNDGFDVRFGGASEDGERVFFATREQHTAGDTDDYRDIYQRLGGVTTLISTGPSGGNGTFDPSFAGLSADGTRVFFETAEKLVAADTDANTDVYERAGGTTSLLSTGPAGGNGTHRAAFRAASSDGDRVLIETTEKLVASDTDSSIDVYQRAGGSTTLLTTGSAGGNGAHDALVKDWSDDGTRVFFDTAEKLVAADTDARVDVYERTGSTTTLLSTGATGGNGPFDAALQNASESGAKVVIGTREALTAGDTDNRIDLYERAGGSTALLSTGPAGGNGPFDAFFSGASADGGRVFFETSEQLAADSDTFPDVYERSAATTTRVSIGLGGSNGAQTAVFLGASVDGARLWFASAEKLASTDTDDGTDVYQVRPTVAYARPKGASYMKLPLVIAYESCTSPNRFHGPPALGGGGPDPSCAPPQPSSAHLTVGTPDSNGQQARASGVASFNTEVGNPATPADEADVSLGLNVTDVRRQGGLGDYTGELQIRVSLSIVDKFNGAAPVDPAALTTFPLGFDATCTGTPDTTVGSTCAAATTADALVPGAVIEGVRTIWQAGAVEVRDGGADGLAETNPNTPFLRQGIFVP